MYPRREIVDMDMFFCYTLIKKKGGCQAWEKFFPQNVLRLHLLCSIFYQQHELQFSCHGFLLGNFSDRKKSPYYKVT